MSSRPPVRPSPYSSTNPNNPLKLRFWKKRASGYIDYWRQESENIQKKIGGIRLTEPQEAEDAWGTLKRALSIDSGLRDGRHLYACGRWTVMESEVDEVDERSCEDFPIVGRHKVVKHNLTPVRPEPVVPITPAMFKALDKVAKKIVKKTAELWSDEDDTDFGDEESFRIVKNARRRRTKKKNATPRDDGYEGDIEDEACVAEIDEDDYDMRSYHRFTIRLVKPRPEDENYQSPPALQPYKTKLDLIDRWDSPPPVQEQSTPNASSSTAYEEHYTSVNDETDDGLQADASESDVATKQPNTTANRGNEPRRLNTVMSMMLDSIVDDDNVSGIEL